MAGNAFGAELRRVIAEASTPGGRRTSYRATGWHAQLAKLTSTPRGSDAADAAGLNPSRRQLISWLAERTTPIRRDQDRIAKAYAYMAGVFPAHLRTAVYSITGQVRIGRDLRERGGRTAPFRVDGAPGDWDDIAELWEAGDLDDESHEDELHDLFVEIVHADLTDLSGEVEFPGPVYSITTA